MSCCYEMPVVLNLFLFGIMMVYGVGKEMPWYMGTTGLDRCLL